MLPGKTFTPEEVLRILWRRKWLLIVPFVVASVCTAILTYRLPKSFRSETLILVVPQRVPESYVRSTVTARIEDRLSTIQQQILSRSRLERIILDFNLYPELRQKLVMEDVVVRMRTDIEVKIERGDAFRVSYVTGVPQTAQKVAERLASLFIEENLRDREVLAEQTNQFLEGQLEDAKRRLLEHEKKLEEYRRRFSGELPSQVDSNLQVIQNAQLQLQALSESVNRDRDRRLLLERQIVDLQIATVAPAVPAASTPSDPVPGEAVAQQLEVATTRLRVLEQRYKPEHPDVLAMKRSIRDLEARLQAEAGSRVTAGESVSVTEPVSPAEMLKVNRLRDLKAELANLDVQIERKQAEDSRLRGVMAMHQTRVDAAPTRESELIELTRDYSTLQNSYASLLAKREESMISANLERQQIGEQFKILDPAKVPERPFSPNLRRLNLMGSAFGLGIGLALIALLEYRDSTFKIEEDVLRVLELPVLALVPLMTSERDRRAHRRRKLLVALGAVFTVLISVAAVVMWRLQAS